MFENHLIKILNPALSFRTSEPSFTESQSRPCECNNRQHCQQRV